MDIKKIKDNIIRFNVFPLSRWNMYCYLIIREKHNYLIDTGCGKNDVDEILTYIKANNLEKDLIVINTHYHWDHIWGNNYTGASYTISTIECYKQIESKYDYMLNRNYEYVKGEAIMCLPNLTFSEKLYLDGFYLFISPGHTVDHISIYDEVNKVLFVGDNIGDNEEEIIPYIEVTKETYISSLKEMLKFDYDLILSGHNDIQPKSFINKILNKIEE